MTDEAMADEKTDPLMPVTEAGAAKRGQSRDGMFGAFLFLWVFSFFAGLVGVIAWNGYREFAPEFVEKERPSITELATPTEPSVSAEAAVASEPQPGNLPQASAESVESPASTVEKGALAVRVLNGGAAKGSAATVADLLKKEGFTKVEAGNATGDYQGMAVYCASGKDAEAKSLSEALQKTYKEVAVKQIPPDVSELASGTCTVVVGAGAK